MKMTPEELTFHGNFDVHQRWIDDPELPTGSGKKISSLWITAYEHAIDLEQAHAVCTNYCGEPFADGTRCEVHETPTVKLTHSRSCPFSTRQDFEEREKMIEGDDDSVRFAYAQVLDYEDGRGMVIVHTWTPVALRGRKLGEKAVRGAVDFVQGWMGRRQKVAATCSFAAHVLAKM